MMELKGATIPHGKKTCRTTTRIFQEHRTTKKKMMSLTTEEMSLVVDAVARVPSIATKKIGLCRLFSPELVAT